MSAQPIESEWAAPALPPVLLSIVDGDAVEDDELSWQELALCAETDPEAFFPEKGGSTREAKKVCLGCDVRAECLEYALTHGERWGIWGGLSERERRKLKAREQQP
jgi:WhiB family redox-sensing transcriptional regulator